MKGGVMYLDNLGFFYLLPKSCRKATGMGG